MMAPVRTMFSNVEVAKSDEQMPLLSPGDWGQLDEDYSLPQSYISVDLANYESESLENDTNLPQRAENELQELFTFALRAWCSKVVNDPRITGFISFVIVLDCAVAVNLPPNPENDIPKTSFEEVPCCRAVCMSKRALE